MKLYKRIIVGMLMTFMVCSASAKDYKASLFGVKSDGQTVNTRSIQKAIDYISEQGGGTLVFYVGRYLTGSVELKSNVSIRIEEGAALMSISSIYDYNKVGDRNALIIANGQKNVSVSGKGVIEGNNTFVTESVETQISKGYLNAPVSKYLPATILFTNCEDVKIDGIMINESADAAIVLDGCAKVEIENVTVNNITSDAEALEIANSKDVKVRDCYFDTKSSAIDSKLNSSNLEFTNCVNPKGAKITTLK
jgi:polygalacturonase